MVAEFLQQRVQLAVEVERFARMPQRVQARGDPARAARIVAHGLVEPPARLADDVRGRVGFDVDHAIAPALGRHRVAGVQHVGIHQHQRIGRGEMVAAAVAEALHARFDRAQAVGFVGVRVERVADDVGAIELDAGAMGDLPELGGIEGIVEAVGHALHGASMACGRGRARRTERRASGLKALPQKPVPRA